ncbi:Zn-ribbon domain-containing OB-fold protein [Mycobacterium pinniadriaticum]|uniref:Zn-ribbon domain-containing OB-fold protein n=1 Tax=Mycobacterium pinniadriaticum TaxID=2994102 RepID=A0ABT3SMH6_9MYCO|nr:Zn-ribbon domain-containing OB-fold protein [Mycobacterium pinniadriaticum]MCX2940709.1 Zn-ribbon domain-containing OB-fold protein [Mycobacterium pinniadriaticum]
MSKPVPNVNSLTEPYWSAASRDELHIQQCPRCNGYSLYPTPWCPHCWYPRPQWTRVSGRGWVFAFTIVHQSPLQSYSGELPYVLAIVRLDEGPQLMANIVGCAPDVVRVGLPVTVVFEQRAGIKVPQFTRALPTHEANPPDRKASS